MEIQTTENLIDCLDHDLAWRKKELTLIINSVQNASEIETNTQLRIGIAMLYAHWEGFIKAGGTYYLIYLSQKDLKYCDLSDNFVALALKNKFTICGQTKKTSLHTKLVSILVNNLSDCADIPHKKIIDTNSNLKWKVFKEILETLGFETGYYETKERLLDNSLVDNRNDIAHGQRVSIELSDFLDLYRDIMDMINHFKEQIIEASIGKHYQKIETS